MELFIQMGHGMQSLAEEHIEDFGSGTIIISPMNIIPKSIGGFAGKIHKKNGSILVDPQLYYPRKFQKNLAKYAYWPQDEFTMLESGGLDDTIHKLVELNREVDSESLILPAFTATKIDDLWNRVQKMAINCAKKYGAEFSRIHTISLSGDVMNDEEQIEKVIAYVEEWEVDGVYIVCEHPERYYLVDKPLWVSNLLSLIAGIKRQHKKTIVGYASHQLLCLSLAKCDAIAS